MKGMLGGKEEGERENEVEEIGKVSRSSYC